MMGEKLDFFSVWMTWCDNSNFYPISTMFVSFLVLTPPRLFPLSLSLSLSLSHSLTHSLTQSLSIFFLFLFSLIISLFFSHYLYLIHYLSLPPICPVGWGCRIHWLHFCRGVRPPRRVNAGMRSNPSLPSVPGPLWPGVVTLDRALSIG